MRGDNGDEIGGRGNDNPCYWTGLDYSQRHQHGRQRHGNGDTFVIRGAGEEHGR